MKRCSGDAVGDGKHDLVERTAALCQRFGEDPLSVQHSSDSWDRLTLPELCSKHRDDEVSRIETHYMRAQRNRGEQAGEGIERTRANRRGPERQ
jgi:hypothetical protein